MSPLGLKVKGEFKFDVYDLSHNLISSSEFHDNFITNTGVWYPYYFAFADCFRYLSLGTGTGVNSIVKNNIFYPETTGLQFPITSSGYAYIGGRPAINGTVTNYGTGCGYTETISGINLFRTWTLPDNTGGYFTENQTFNEFMVTPGQPYVTGTNGIPACTCDETFDGGTTYGNDCSTVAMYYTWLQNLYLGQEYRPKMCDATKAFARLVYPVTVSANTILNVTYRLSLNPDTGIHLLSLSNNAGITNNPNWTGILNGVSRITQPGVKFINDGTINSNIPTAPNGHPRLQHYNYTGAGGNIYQFNQEYGESFIPPLGMPLEPSNVSIGSDNPDNQNIAFYVSTDNTEFLVSCSGNFTNTGNYAPWTTGQPVIYPFTSGLDMFWNNNSVAISEGSAYWSSNPNAFNIRTSSGLYPNTGDITQTSSPTINYYVAPDRNNPQFSWQTMPVTSGIRTGQVSTTFQFEQFLGILGTYNLPVKSFVAAYKDLNYGSSNDINNLVPFFDCLFSGTGIGAVFIPQIITGNSIYTNGNNTGAYISGAGNPNYFYLGPFPASYPIFTTILTWTVPCPQGVTGC